MAFIPKTAQQIRNDIIANKQPIQVIASFSCTGEVLPMYAKINDCIMKLFHVTRITRNQFADRYSMLFKCQYIIENRDPEDNSEKIFRELRIEYLFELHMWVVVSIQK